MTPDLQVPQGADVLAAQLAAIDAWLTLRRADHIRLVPRQDTSLEQRQDLRAGAIALDIEAAALREHCSRGEHQPRPMRVVLVHRNTWLIARLSQGLTDLGMRIAGTANDGAVGSGIAIAEAPDLVLLEASLPTLTGAEVARRVLECSPTTTLTAQVAYPAQARALLEAGATAIWSRRVPPADLVQAVGALLQRPRQTRDRVPRAPRLVT